MNCTESNRNKRESALIANDRDGRKQVRNTPNRYYPSVHFWKKDFLFSSSEFKKEEIYEHNNRFHKNES